MRKIVVSAATVHTPYITGWPETAPAADRTATYAGFSELGNVFRTAGVRVLVVVTSEHIVNLQPRMAPAFTVGVGDEHPIFPEPHFNLRSGTLRGARSFALALAKELYRHGFDPAHAVEMRLDHGTLLPLQLMDLIDEVEVVPVLVNTLFPPLPTLRRCRALGEAIREIVEAMPGNERVGLLATGGISHTVGRPGVEKNDPAFDRKFIADLTTGALDSACGINDGELDAIGNGTHEIRNWIAVAAAAGTLPSIVTAIPFAPGWNSGVYQLLWRAA